MKNVAYLTMLSSNGDDNYHQIISGATIRCYWDNSNTAKILQNEVE